MGKCPDCGKRTSAMNRCLNCKTAVRKMFKQARERGWIVDLAGGSWWVWDKIGNVLAQHDTSNIAALRLAMESNAG